MPTPPTPPRRPYCTPPGLPRIPNVPICRPMFRGMVTPFGGPASGISPAGGVSPPASAPGVIVTPPVPPVCVTASIFADCFTSCTGVINGASPGPVCGWTYIEPFGPLGGQFTFTPGQMMMDTFDADDFPIASKPFSASLASIFGISGQFDFTEHQTVPNLNTTYQLLINNFDISETYFVGLFGDGGVVVQAGSSASLPTYSGTWTPNNGAHVVHFAVDGVGVPTLFIDGVPIPLVFVANLAPFGPYPADSVSYGGGSGDATPDSAPIRSIFVTAGSTPPDTEFCCS